MDEDLRLTRHSKIVSLKLNQQEDRLVLAFEEAEDVERETSIAFGPSLGCLCSVNPSCSRRCFARRFCSCFVAGCTGSLHELTAGDYFEVICLSQHVGVVVFHAEVAHFFDLHQPFVEQSLCVGMRFIVDYISCGPECDSTLRFRGSDSSELRTI